MDIGTIMKPSDLNVLFLNTTGKQNSFFQSNCRSTALSTFLRLICKPKNVSPGVFLDAVFDRDIQNRAKILGMG